MLYIRFSLSLRNVEDLLHERGIEIYHETVRFWWNRFGPMFGEHCPWKSRIGREQSDAAWQRLSVSLEANGLGWRRFDSSLVPSAKCLREIVLQLQLRLRPNFSVVCEGYAGRAEHWPPRQKDRKRSPWARILWTS